MPVSNPKADISKLWLEDIGVVDFPYIPLLGLSAVANPLIYRIALVHQCPMNVQPVITLGVQNPVRAVGVSVQVPDLPLAAVARGGIDLDPFLGRRSLEGSGEVRSQIYVVVPIRKVGGRIGGKIVAPRQRRIRSIANRI